MNRTITTILAFGAGMAAYNLVQRTDIMGNQQIRQWQKQIKRAFS